MNRSIVQFFVGLAAFIKQALALADHLELSPFLDKYDESYAVVKSDLELTQIPDKAHASLVPLREAAAKILASFQEDRELIVKHAGVAAPREAAER